jgi:hypothetical protein
MASLGGKKYLNKADLAEFIRSNDGRDVNPDDYKRADLLALAESVQQNLTLRTPKRPYETEGQRRERLEHEGRERASLDRERMEIERRERDRIARLERERRERMKRMDTKEERDKAEREDAAERDRIADQERDRIEREERVRDRRRRGKPIGTYGDDAGDRGKKGRKTRYSTGAGGRDSDEDRSDSASDSDHQQAYTQFAGKLGDPQVQDLARRRRKSKSRGRPRKLSDEAGGDAGEDDQDRRRRSGRNRYGANQLFFSSSDSDPMVAEPTQDFKAMEQLGRRTRRR